MMTLSHGARLIANNRTREKFAQGPSRKPRAGRKKAKKKNNVGNPESVEILGEVGHQQEMGCDRVID